MSVLHYWEPASFPEKAHELLFLYPSPFHRCPLEGEFSVCSYKAGPWPKECGGRGCHKSNCAAFVRIPDSMWLVPVTPGQLQNARHQGGHDVSTLGCLWSHVLPAPQGAHCLCIRMHLKKKTGESDPISALANRLINTQRGSGTLRPLRSGPQQNNPKCSSPSSFQHRHHHLRDI